MWRVQIGKSHPDMPPYLVACSCNRWDGPSRRGTSPVQEPRWPLQPNPLFRFQSASTLRYLGSNRCTAVSAGQRAYLMFLCFSKPNTIETWSFLSPACEPRITARPSSDSPGVIAFAIATLCPGHPLALASCQTALVVASTPFAGAASRYVMVIQVPWASARVAEGFQC